MHEGRCEGWDRRWARSYRHWLPPVAATAVAVAMVACSARDPEPPGSGAEPIILLSSPDSIYVQMQVGIESEFVNSYGNCFDQDEFGFHLDSRDSILLVDQLAQLDPEELENWNRQIEEQVHTSIFGTSQALEIVFVGAAEDSGQTISENVVELRKHYQLNVDGEVYEGAADWTLVRKSGEWRITQWQDNRESGSQNSTWGFLKGLNR